MTETPVKACIVCCFKHCTQKTDFVEEIPEDGKAAVEDELKETGGEISSVKKEYDEEGSLVTTTVTITYVDENGTNHRSEVVIENSKGGTNK